MQRGVGQAPRQQSYRTGALERTRTSTPFRAQALNLPRIPIPPPGQAILIIHATKGLSMVAKGGSPGVKSGVTCDVFDNPNTRTRALE